MLNVRRIVTAVSCDTVLCNQIPSQLLNIPTNYELFQS